MQARLARAARITRPRRNASPGSTCLACIRRLPIGHFGLLPLAPQTADRVANQGQTADLSRKSPLFRRGPGT